MVKTKIDRVLELLEKQLEEKQEVQTTVSNLGTEGVHTSETPAQIPAMNITADSDAEVSNVTYWSVENATFASWPDGSSQDTGDLNVDQLPEKSDAAEAPNEQQSDTFDRDFAELAAMVGYDVNSKSEQESEKAEQQSDPVDEPLTEEENQNYKKMFDQEVERRIAAEGEARNAAAEAKYRKNMLEKEGDKYYSNIDKQKELEAELRVANAAKMPDQIAPLWQSYLLWEETKTPTHKWRAIKDALTLVENMTWVSAEDYYWTILRAENKDIPEVTEKSSITSTSQNINGQSKWNGFLML